MKTIKPILGRLLVGCVFALCLASNIHAQIPPFPDPEDDPGDPPTQEEQEAAYQAWLATLHAEYTNNFAPWIHGNELTEQGVPQSSSFSSWQVGGVGKLLALGGALGGMQAEQYEAATNFALANDWPLQRTNDSGGLEILTHLEGERPIYIGSFNVNAADTVGADELWTNGSSGLNLNGEGTQVAVWEVGDPRLTHREFTTNSVRLIDMDGVSPQGVQDHATHVSGTLGAYGVTAGAKGMANRALVLANDTLLHYEEMPAQFATNQFRLSNHSYGIAAIGWDGVFNHLGTLYPFWWGDPVLSTTEDFLFGFYNGDSRSIDQIAYASRYYLPVWAAGNERGPRGKPVISQANGYVGLNNGALWFFPGVTRPDDGGADGYDTLPPHGVAKNCLTVGAVTNIIGGYSGSNSVVMSTFSSFGPPDSGHIKPDLVSAGVNVLSSGAFSDSFYYSESGTSMASPNTCGALNLLVQLHIQYMGINQPMLSSTLRGLAIHTADEAGTTAGPDYRFGWGLLNVLTGARLMTNNFLSGSIPFIKEVRIANGDFIEFPVVAKGGEPLKITICWIDPAGNPVGVSVDPTNRMLINDFDLRVIAPNGATNFPYVLNPASPAAAAATADNDRDNVEQSNIASPVTNGVYIVRVTHKGTLRNDTGAISDQWVSILVSGNVAQTEPPVAIERIAQVSTNTIGLRWTANVGRIYQVVHRANIASGSWSPATGEISATKTNVAVELPMNGDTRFYRLVRIR